MPFQSHPPPVHVVMLVRTYIIVKKWIAHKPDEGVSVRKFYNKVKMIWALVLKTSHVSHMTTRLLVVDLRDGLKHWHAVCLQQRFKTRFYFKLFRRSSLPLCLSSDYEKVIDVREGVGRTPDHPVILVWSCSQIVVTLLSDISGVYNVFLRWTCSYTR
jgi:hypothetical protein